MVPSPRCLLLLFVLWPVASRAAPPSAPDLWLGALEPPSRAARGLAPNDYLDLFRADAPWPTVAAHLTEVVLSKRFVMQAPAEMLAAVVGDLARRHIGVAMQVRALVPGPACGANVTGYGPRDDARQQAERIRRAGGTLDAAVLEGPMWFGHFFAGSADHPACQMPVADVAAQALAKVAQLRAVFPAVRIGAAEPVGAAADVHDLDAGLVELNANLTLKTGHRLAFLQAEVDWQRPGWQEALRTTEAFVRTQGVRFGVVYNGGFGDPPDAAWSAATRRHYTEVEQSLGLAPDIADFASATPRPARLLPEGDRDTLTGVVLGYLRFRAIVK
jgi:hypothetical protein